MQPATVFGIYRVTCLMCALVNVALAWVCFASISQASAINQSLPEALRDYAPDWYIRVVFIAIGAVGVFFAVLNAYVPLGPRNPKWWVAHLINLILIAGSCLLTIPAVVVLFNWFRPDVRAMFGFEPPRPPEGAQRP
jgi:hypothetical protein